MVDGFAGLLHDAVVGGNHQNNKVGHLGTTGTHGRKGFVAGRIKEHDFTALGLDVVSANVLGDAACFAAGDVGLAYGVEQRGFTVVNVTHDGNHGRARLERFRRVHFLGNQIIVFREADLFNFVPEFGGHKGGGVDIEGLVDGGHDAKTKENLDDLVGFQTHLVGHVGNADGFGNTDLALGCLQGLGGLRRNRRTALLAAALAPVQTTAVVIIAAATKIALLEVNSAATLKALLFALSVAGVRGRGRRSLLPKAASRTTGTGATSRTGCAAGATKASGTETAGSASAIAGRVAAGPASAITRRITAGAAITLASGAGFLRGRSAWSRARNNTNLRCGRGLGTGRTTRCSAFFGTISTFAARLGRTLRQRGRRGAFGHSRGIGASHAGGLGGLVLGVSLIRSGLFSRGSFHYLGSGRGFRGRGGFHNRGRNGGSGSGSFRCFSFSAVAGAADNASGRNNLGRFDNAGLGFCRRGSNRLGLGGLGRNGFFRRGRGRGGGCRFGYGFDHGGFFLGGVQFNRRGNGGFLHCGFRFQRGVLAAAAYDNAGVRTGALRINLFLFGKVVAQASGLL